ncbi:hypothetical protein [Neisseria sp. Ec49-e6-T10]|uniref:hypothetical protein n=1 Tax=Neisseria sp. Ec49-e6-T10 TaxID=3140744 RepID=UPI003EBDA110
MLKKISISILCSGLLLLSACSEKSQEKTTPDQVKDAIIDHTQGRLNDMKDDVKKAEDLANQKFKEAEENIGKTNGNQ